MDPNNASSELGLIHVNHNFTKLYLRQKEIIFFPSGV
jgi:hypothetical protein